MEEEERGEECQGGKKNVSKVVCQINECVPNKNTKPISPKPNAKLGRCPNGTRRNPKTLLCEPKPIKQKTV